MSNTKGSSENEDFNKYFKDKLEHWEDEPPVDGWKSIENVLDKKQANLTKWYTAAAVLLLLAPALYFLFSSKSSSQKEVATELYGSSTEDNIAILQTEDANSASCIEIPKTNCDQDFQDKEQGLATTKYERDTFGQTDTENSNSAIQKELITNISESGSVAQRSNDNNKTKLEGTREKSLKEDEGVTHQPAATGSEAYSQESHAESMNVKTFTSETNANNANEQTYDKAVADVKTGATNGRDRMSLYIEDTPTNKLHETTEKASENHDRQFEKSNGNSQEIRTFTDRSNMAQSLTPDLHDDDANESNAEDKKKLIEKADDESLPADSHTALKNSNIVKPDRNKHTSKTGSKKPKSEALDSASTVETEKKILVKKKEKTAPFQDNKKRNGSSKWHFQPEIGTFYTFKKVNPAKDMIYITGFENENEMSFKNAGYQISLKLRREVLQNTTITTGITWQMINEYSNYNFYNIIADSVEVTQVQDDSFDVITYSNEANNEVHNTVQYAGLSLGVIQRVKFLRREYNLTAGVSLLKSISHKYSENEYRHTFDAKSTLISVRGGLEKVVSLTPYWSFTVTPYVEQTFSSIYTNSTYRLSPLKIGLDIGLLIPTGRK
ncbi:hypothetical protein LVD17_18795 [Fulvivirga ulvae]|uniref:hypothetical protein n=1 Tax=Fulvivirga ulvae TaxID=2904245 RepID=UPI001F2ADFEA|nr:hypothetical protein [Fulvivirga ulvae]UII30343.1 hypothetical protein LVD17_18795 [Fulvivirga ulvae]